MADDVSPDRQQPVAPSRESAPPVDDAPAPPPMAPDVAVSLFDVIRARQSIKVTLSYLAIGWALLEFASVVIDDTWPGYRTFLNSYVVVYISGFFIVLTGAYLVLAGRHPLRSLALSILVLASFGGGLGLAIVGGFVSWPFGARVPATVAGVASGAVGGTAAAPQLPSDQEQQLSSPGSAPQAPPDATDTIVANRQPAEQQPVRGDAALQALPVESERVVPPVARAQSQGARGNDARAGEAPAQAAEPATARPDTRQSATPPAAAPMVDPADAKFDELVLMFGEQDQLDVDTARPYQLLARFDRPVAVRLVATSGGALLTIQDRNLLAGRFRRLDMRNRGDRVTEQVVIPTGCGEFAYQIDATLLTTRSGSNMATARVTIRLDRAGARQAIARAQGLGRCL